VHLRRRTARATALAGAVSLLAAGLLAGPVTPAAADEPVAPGPVVTTREVVGTSVEGRPIVAVHRARAGATRTVLVIGSIHGDEKAGLRVVRLLRDRTYLPADLDLWLVPTANPDGVALDTRTNAHGVDLNRNFPYRWRPSAHGAPWRGPRWLSEPESRALRALHWRIDPRLTIVFHQPLFGVGANDDHRRLVRELATGMRLPVDEFHCSGVCNGTFTGWINHRTDGVGVTVEFGRTVPAWRIWRAAHTVVEVGSALV
jgi:succinylglutamate desuccinylase